MGNGKYWAPESPAGQHDDEEYQQQHFDPYSDDLKQGRFVRVSNDMRERCPVAHSDVYEDGFWTIARYADIEAIHQDPVSYSSFPVTVPPFGNVRPMIPLEADPPLHKDFRRIITEQLSRAVQNKKAEQYRAFAKECIDGFIDRGECDVSKELCTPLALQALMDALGVPVADRAHMEDVANRLVRKIDPAKAAADLYAYFTDLIELRRREPEDDIVTRLVQAEIGGTPLTDIEILDYAMVLVPAGFETTASSMSYMFLLLAERPDLQERLRADLSLIPPALEELVRYVTPVRGLSRTVMTDVEIGEQILRRGDRLHLNWAAANHDPTVFKKPEEVQIDRSPNRHMGFGLGAHLCIGIHMARIEMRVAFEETLQRMTNIRLQDAESVVEEAGTTWGISSLPIQFDRVTV